MQTNIATADRRLGGPVGVLLREWRAARGMSQLDLAMHAGFSARHVSFIETGRTQPSRQAMAHVRSVLQFILDRHKPYAAVVLDRYANCLMGNGASEQLVAALVDASLLTAHMNHLRVLFHPLGVRRWIVNWEEVARHMLGRAERELGHAANDDTAASLLSELRGYVGASVPLRSSPTVSAGDLLLPIHIRKGDLELRIFSTIMTLGTPQDVTLQELRVETFFPADDASERAWQRVTSDQ